MRVSEQSHHGSPSDHAPLGIAGCRCDEDCNPTEGSDSKRGTTVKPYTNGETTATARAASLRRFSHSAQRPSHAKHISLGVHPDAETAVFFNAARHRLAGNADRARMRSLWDMVPELRHSAVSNEAKVNEPSS
jgi:hypothetical protein